MPKQIAQYTQYHSVNFSADGARAISAFSEGIAYGVAIWDAKTGQEVKRLPLEAPINHLMLSPDGEQALILMHEETRKVGELGRERSEYDSKDTVIIWTIDQDKTEQHTFLQGDGQIPPAYSGFSGQQTGLSPNSQHLVILLENPFTLTIRPAYNPDNITQTLEVGKKVATFAWSPDSTKILFADFDSLGAKEKTRKNRVWIWDISTGDKMLFTELAYDAEYTYGVNQDQKAWGIREISGLQWHGDLMYIVYDRKIQVWEV